jgi:branched-chain amino acid transport system permease protein
MPPASSDALRRRVNAWGRLAHWTDGLGFGVLIVLVVVAPSVLSVNNLSVATTGESTAIALLGLGIVTNRAGMMSLAQFGFMAIGAYVFIWLQLHSPSLSFPLAILIGGLATIPFGIVVGLPALRLRGVLLGVVTLALATALSVYLDVKEFPGLNSGFVVSAPSWLVSEPDFFRFCGVVFIVVAIGVSLAARMKIGHMWSSIRYSERATAGLGRSVLISKLTAFAFSAFLGGIAGALLVGQFGIVSSQSFEPINSLTLFALAIMVGARYPEGALIGGMLYAFMPIILGDLNLSQNYGNLLFAVGAVVGLRGGLGMADEIRAQVRRLKRRGAGTALGRIAGELPGAGRLQARRAARAVHSAGSLATPSTNGSTPDLAADSAPALEVKGLTHKYGAVTALNDVNLAVMPGTVVALIGPNGAGKSTLIDCVSGFTRATAGQILLAGEDMTGLPAHQRANAGVRRTFQQGRTIPELTIEEYVRLGLTRAQNVAMDDRELGNLLAFLDCPAPRTLIKEVDVGTRRVIEVAAALAPRPKVVMLDEPSAGLGTNESLALAARIAAMPQVYGSSVLLVEHDMEMVNAAASQVVVIDFGNVIASGPPAEVMSDSNVVHAYLGEEVTV